MTPGAVEAYLRRLERELRQQGLEDARIVEEAREHLADAVADGRRRGLSVDEAEYEALERFGAPETIAAHVVSERAGMMTRFAGVFDTVWRRKWWILAPTVLTAVVTSVLSYYFLPTRYRSESIIGVVSAMVPAEYVRPTATGPASERLQSISQQVLSRTRLERIISDFDLYQAERASTPLSDVVLQMRKDIDVDFLLPDRAPDSGLGGFSVSFVSSDPRMAVQITERLARLFIEENLRDRKAQAQGTRQFLQAQIEDVRRRLIETETTLEALRSQNGRRPVSQADLLPYEVLQDRYRALLVQSEEAATTANLERRQIGEQFRVIDAPRLPEGPVGPSRAGVNVAGALAGLGLGLVLVRVRGRSNQSK